MWKGEMAFRTAEGREIPVSQVLVAHKTEDGSGVRFYSTIARDISDRRAYEARIEYLAHYDSASGLPNRTLLGDRTGQSIAHAKRSGRSCGLLLLKVDRLNL